MSLFRGNFSIAALAILVLIILTGLVIILAKPVWSLEGKTSMNIDVRQIATMDTYCLLDHQRYDFLRIYHKVNNTILQYSNRSTGKQSEMELTKRQVSDYPVVKTNDNAWFCLRDDKYNCFLASAFNENQEPVPSQYLLHENPWTEDLTRNYSIFDDSLKIGFNVYKNCSKPFEIITEADETLLQLQQTKYMELMNLPIIKVDESPKFKEIANTLTEYLHREFTNRDVYRIITDRMRKDWLNSSLDNARGERFFNGKILAASDINGDGSDELIVIVAGDRLFPGYLLCYDIQNKTNLWKLPMYTTLEHLYFQDIDNDGIEEIILAFYASGIKCSSDWFDHPIKLQSTKSYVVVLDNNGHVKKFRDKEAILITGGYASRPIICPLDSGKILVAPTHSNDNAKHKLLSVDFLHDQIDTLSISYNDALMMDKTGDIIEFYTLNNGILKKTRIGSDLIEMETVEKFQQDSFSLDPGANCYFQNEKYQILSPLKIINGELNTIYSDSSISPTNIMQRGNTVYLSQNIPSSSTNNLIKITLSENHNINYNYVVIWIFLLILLLVYIVTKAMFSIPQDTVDGSYAVLYRFLGFIYNWRIFGKTSVYTQPVIGSLSQKKFYNIITDLCENYQELSVRNLGFVKLYVYRLAIDNEMHIVQRIAHDIKNQVHLVNLQLQEGLCSENITPVLQSEIDKVALTISEIFNKTSMLSNFSRINLMQMEKCNLISIIDDILIRYNAHPRFQDIVWDPEFDRIMIMGDENLLLTAIMNIMENAIKYSPPHTQIFIGISLSKETVSLIFRNTRIVEVNLKQISDSIPSGSGIGLLITEKIVLNHDGKFEFLLINGDAQIEIELQCLNIL